MPQRDALPIDAVVGDIAAALRGQRCVVVQAPTGAGKTTRVPPALLDAGLAGDRRIVMLEPRRLAARAAARRMASERGTRLGEEVGYQVRFDRHAGPGTRILVVTEGILVRMLQTDASLDSIALVIFDEFHERSLDTDLALAMTRLVQQTVRPDLRIVVMSATLAAREVASYLGDCPIIASEGRLHPVEIVYEPRSLPWPVAAARAVERMLDRTRGDVLVFLPGLREIRQTAHELETIPGERELAVRVLHGDLPAEQQDAALLPGDRRKVVLATNVAETSVTVEGVTAVVDTGLARMMVFDPHVGLDRLQLVPISRASAEQRAGRAGRTQPGLCVRLWSEASHRSRAEQTPPEIRRVDLAGPVLQLLAWGEKDITGFPWLLAPPEAAVRQAHELLERLGAVRDGEVTERGRTLARLPLHPRLGTVLVAGQQHGCAARAALAAALLSERDPFLRDLQTTPNPRRTTTSSDVLDRVEALEDFERTGRCDTPVGRLGRGTARFVLHARDQLLRLMRSGTPTSPSREEDSGLLRALLEAFPDRVARRRERGSRSGVMVGGRGVRLLPTSAVSDAELFVCVDVDAGQTETLVRQASAIERDWLPTDRLRTSVEVTFDPAAERVSARRRVYYEDLVLEENPAALPEDTEVARVLLAAARGHADRVLPPDDSPGGRLRTRVRCLREWMPELQLPALTHADLVELLPEVAAGCRSFEDLRQAPWLDVLRSRLTPRQWQAVERKAPERILVPSGSRIALSYEVGRPPVLAVRIQEVFGWADTPRVAGGRVRVLLHLLAPNQRPEQVSDDLASFWTNTYPRIRNALRARYPKHAWPEDPLTAVPERRPRRRPEH